MKKDTRSIIEALSSGPVRQYLTDHEHSDLRKIILRNKEILGIPTAELYQQIAARKKAREKLPSYYETPNIVYPPQENLEQSSSETTARLKAEIITEELGSAELKGVDFTGGFGVDTYFLSRIARTFHAVEPNESLLEIAKFNHGLLRAGNITYHNTTAEEFVKSPKEQLDFGFIDPSRRTATQKKAVAFENCEPDVVQLAPQIFEHMRVLLVKGSPLLDLQAGIAQLPFVKRVIVVSVANECKELLFLCERDWQGTPTIEAFNIASDGTRQTFVFTFPEERELSSTFSEPLEFLYEPNASILKAGAFKTVASRYDVVKLHANTHLYTSSSLVEKFPGRIFRIEEDIKPDRTAIRRVLPEGQANVTTRNYPLAPEALKKKLGLKDGGDRFVIGFTGPMKKHLVVAVRV